MYISVIVDECGTVLYRVAEIGWVEAEKLLDEHPEWIIETISVACDYDYEY